MLSEKTIVMHKQLFRALLIQVRIDTAAFGGFFLLKRNRQTHTVYILEPLAVCLRKKNALQTAIPCLFSYVPLSIIMLWPITGICLNIVKWKLILARGFSRHIWQCFVPRNCHFPFDWCVFRAVFHREISSCCDATYFTVFRKDRSGIIGSVSEWRTSLQCILVFFDRKQLRNCFQSLIKHCFIA